MDFVITFAGQWAVILGLVVILALARQVKVHIGWLIAAIAFFALECAAVIGGHFLIPLDQYFGPLNWNWGGKALGVCVSILLVTLLWFVARKPLSESGFTFAQKPGSIVPAIIMMLILVGGSVGTEIWAHDGTDTGTERLLFQATMPGFDEEPFWRGVFLLAMNEALRGGRLGRTAQLSWAGLLLSIFFGLVHGFNYGEGAWHFSWLIVGLTGAIGFGLYWIRERTGSILLPIVAHNLINVSNSFF